MSFALNRIVLITLLDLERRDASATVTVQAGKARRAIHLENGQLVGADSNLKAERLGDMLVAEGTLDPLLLEPVAAEASKRGVLIGDQLVADRLLTQADLTSALERQVALRLGAALSMRGLVAVDSLRDMAHPLKTPLRAALFSAFRRGVPLGAIEEQLKHASDGPISLDLENLELGPAELRLARRLLAGEKPEQLVAGGAPREPVLRLAGAIHALHEPGA
ncbi:MAG: hypothetical protein ACOZQL_18590 [Myxococcota bacterium]